MSYPNAWLIHDKLLQVMAVREECYVFEGKIQMNKAYLGGQRSGGKVGRGSENKFPLVAEFSLSEEWRPRHAQLTPVPGFALQSISAWAKDHLAP